MFACVIRERCGAYKESLWLASETLVKNTNVLLILEKTTRWMTLSNSSKKKPMNTTNSIATGFTVLGVGKFVDWEELKVSFCLKSRIVLTSEHHVAMWESSCPDVCNCLRPSDGLLRILVRFALLEPLEDRAVILLYSFLKKQHLAWRYSRGASVFCGKHHFVVLFSKKTTTTKYGMVSASNQASPTSAVNDAFYPIL